METFLIENATQCNGGLDYISNNARIENWEPGIIDLQKLFYPTDPTGFFIGIVQQRHSEDDETGGTHKEIVGCVSGVAFDDAYGFIGYYIVDPKYRGKYTIANDLFHFYYCFLFHIL